MFRSRRPVLHQIVVVVLSVAVAAWLRHLLTPLLGHQRAFATFGAPVLLCAWYGGLLAGLAATGLSAVAALAFWIEPAHSLMIRDPADQVGLLLFILSSLVITWSIAILHQGLGELKAANKELHAEIAARRHREEVFQEGEQRLRLVVDATLDGFWDWDLLTNKVFWSDRMYAMVDVPPGTRVQGVDTLTQLMHLEDRGRFSQALGALLEHNRPFNVEVRLRCAGGTYVPYRSIGKALRGPSGRTVRVAGSFAALVPDASRLPAEA